jgi:hypothetical protein
MDLVEFECYNKELYDVVIALCEKAKVLHLLAEIEVVEPIGYYELVGLDHDGEEIFEADISDSYEVNTWELR